MCRPLGGKSLTVAAAVVLLVVWGTGVWLLASGNWAAGAALTVGAGLGLLLVLVISDRVHRRRRDAGAPAQDDGVLSGISELIDRLLPWW